MELTNREKRLFLLSEFKKGHSAADAYRNICSVFHEASPSRRTCYDWYAKFNSGDFDIEDKPRAGRPSVIENDRLRERIEENPGLTTRKLGEEFGVSHPTIVEHLAQLGLTSKLNRYVPHNLTPEQKHSRVDACMTLLERNRKSPFLDRLITSDEKWVFYDNPVRERNWSEPGHSRGTTPKRTISNRKIQWCVWWDCHGIIHQEFLPPGQTINAPLYCQQLERVQKKLMETRPALINRKGVVYLHDNARPHASGVTQKKIFDLNWETIEHPPYSPDLAPSDYHLFRALQNYLRGKTVDSGEDAKKEIGIFLASCSPDFYHRGIYKLVERWSEVRTTYGEYILD